MDASKTTQRLGISLNRLPDDHEFKWVATLQDISGQPLMCFCHDNTPEGAAAGLLEDVRATTPNLLAD
jgi:hypothetical protein